jgi:hypothetical protein
LIFREEKRQAEAKAKADAKKKGFAYTAQVYEPPRLDIWFSLPPEPRKVQVEF